ncbi:rhomboid-related like protein [Babesia gibsoni]|uniref:Rhomboid-like protease n=1 Tax=Babesia gibsoni TaxID=33632 RepID=A0AAD8PEA4_BABGI|nr:rhomboid-related like protein [Babesia gibsoni]
MGKEDKPAQDSSDDAPSDAPRRSHVESILHSNIYNRGKDSGDERQERTSKGLLHPSDRCSKDASSSLAHERRERTLMLASKYEEILDARKSVDKAANRLSVDHSDAAGASRLKHVSRDSVAKPEGRTPAAGARGSESGPRIVTTQDLNERRSVTGLSGLVNLYRRRPTRPPPQPAPYDTKKIPKCIIRRYVKEQIFPGRMIFCISSSIVLLLMFVFQMYLNYWTFNGRCVGYVDYTSNTNGKSLASPIGYVGCERNLSTFGKYRAKAGLLASDRGYPTEHVALGDSVADDATNSGPNMRTVKIFGAAVAMYIRNYGELSRFFTAIMLHNNANHLLINLLCHVHLLYIIEPDWGFLRTLATYVISGYTGTMFAVFIAPCGSVVGASGAIFGLFGALIPYLVEHWDNLVCPFFIFIESLVFLLQQFFISSESVSIENHLCGYTFGLCFGFMTIKSVALFDRRAVYYKTKVWLFGHRMSAEKKNEYLSLINKGTNAEEMSRMQYEGKAKANAQRLKLLKRLIGVYPYGPYRTRRRDHITRFIFLTIFTTLFVVLHKLVWDESLYTKLYESNHRIFRYGCKCCYVRNDTDDAMLNQQVSHLHGHYFCFPEESADIFCPSERNTKREEL